MQLCQENHDAAEELKYQSKVLKHDPSEHNHVKSLNNKNRKNDNLIHQDIESERMKRSLSQKEKSSLKSELRRT